jgi:hypothetical protein
MGTEKDHHLYPVDEPDVALAEKLWASRADRVVLLTCKSPLCTEQANLLRRGFSQLGVTLAIRTVTDQFNVPAGNADLRLENWFLDEYDPSNLLGPPDSPEAVLFATDPPLNGFGNHSVQMEHQADAAQRLSGDRRHDAYAALAQEAPSRWASRPSSPRASGASPRRPRISASTSPGSASAASDNRLTLSGAKPAHRGEPGGGRLTLAFTAPRLRAIHPLSMSSTR